MRRDAPGVQLMPAERAADQVVRSSASAYGGWLWATPGAGHGIMPLIEGIPVERVRNSLGLPMDGAVAVAALINDLARARSQLH
jgi:hypothetical protein